jgi:hypothetical protein
VGGYGVSGGVGGGEEVGNVDICDVQAGGTYSYQ